MAAMQTARTALRRDGIVKVPGLLDAAALAAAQDAYDWSLAHPGRGASMIAQASEATFFNDLFNPDCLQRYRAMLETSPIPRLVSELWDGSPVWFFYEQVFLKEGGETRRTPWHQDSSYLAIAGAHLVVAWIAFDPVAEENALEFVRGSHLGPLYNGSRFELGDDTAPLHPQASLPRLPDIEADRGSFDIVSFPVEPGDVVLFHFATLHGGAATHAGGRRRTLSLRFFGEEAVYDPREGRAGPPTPGFHERMRPGEPFRDPAFPRLI
jgi:ectoine hydroxylase-related dioxygenase (phytanoyl-CoA dioxygenase family)